MKALAVTGALTSLDALPPSAATVVALAAWQTGAARPALRPLILSDPGMTLAWLSLLDDAALWPTSLSAAEDQVDQLMAFLHRHEPTHLAEWQTACARDAYRCSQALAQVARRLAEIAGVDPDRAELAGLLSLLGSLSLHARPGDRKRVNGEAAPRTRQLVRRLKLPAWLHDALLHLDLPVSDGEQDRLTLVVQVALGLISAKQLPIGHVKLGHILEDALRLLDVKDVDDEIVRQAWARVPTPPLSMPPPSTPLFWQALRLAPPQTPVPATGVIARLETELEGMRSQLLDRWQDEQARVAGLKLESMAEFAAGAAHEINTPLAIISGQAQHLLKSEESLDRAQALERVMSQAHKIHHLLRDLLLFARPPVPQRKRVAMARLVRKVAKDLANLASQRQVRVDVVAARDATLQGDPGLLEMAVTSLLCNAIEAASTDGWVRVTIKAVRPNRFAVVIEDNGPGLSPAQHKHLFDPFYSGRAAGRGTGLGLSKAWRIAKIHGGILHGPIEGVQPTRFVLELPLTAPKPRRQSRSSRRRQTATRR